MKQINFFKKHSKLIHRKINNSNSSIFIKFFYFSNELSHKEILSLNDFTGKFHQKCNEEIVSIEQKDFRKLKIRG